MSHPDRRAVLAAGAVLAAASAQGAAAQGHVAPPAGAGFTPKPLPFDPTKVLGLSEKLLRSHYDNNYTGAVKRLGAITQWPEARRADRRQFRLAPRAVLRHAGRRRCIAGLRPGSCLGPRLWQR